MQPYPIHQYFYTARRDSELVRYFKNEYRYDWELNYVNFMERVKSEKYSKTFKILVKKFKLIMKIMFGNYSEEYLLKVNEKQIFKDLYDSERKQNHPSYA